jgi:hypothetical protein
MTIFWAGWGPLMRYQHGFLDIEDLNPEIKTRWRMSRWEMARVGFRFIVAALKP